MNGNRMRGAIVFLVLFCSVYALPPAEAQSLWREGRRGGLVADQVAAGRGDILTILVRERYSVDTQDKTERSQESSLDAKLTVFDIKPNAFNTLPAVAGSSKRSFTGSAAVARDATMTWRLAVTVVDVQPNGNLVVEGKHTVVVDNQERTMIVTGVVRPLDVSTDNVVLSENVANASVRIVGDGPNTRAAERGMVGRIVHFIFDNLWPF